MSANNIPLFFQKLNTLFLDALFPINCLSCRKDNVWLCEKCLRNLPLLSFQVCPYCEKEITVHGAICERCRMIQLEKNSSIALRNLICATEYQKVSKLIHLFKYNFISELGVPLGKIIARALQKNNLPLPELIIPIPIHQRKLKWRGFNQAEILASSVSLNLTPGLAIPVRTDLIFRQKNTSAQMKIKTYAKRFDNLKNAFALTPGAKEVVSGKKILLIDDVATTGATLFECAKVLKSAGAKEISGAIIARQKI